MYRTLVACVLVLIVKSSSFVVGRCFASQLDALEQSRRQWGEAQRRCEVWAYKLDSCNCVTGRTTLAGYAEGGGPPRVCVRAMHASLQEGYCKALR